MLRASAEATGQAGELTTVQDPDAHGGVTAASALAALVDNIVDGDTGNIAKAKDAVTADLGSGAAVDAIAVLANFEMMTRIADATGARHQSVDEEVARRTGADRFTGAPG
jgi:hypothetical protein